MNMGGGGGIGHMPMMGGMMPMSMYPMMMGGGGEVPQYYHPMPQYPTMGMMQVGEWVLFYFLLLSFQKKNYI
jgi:hypothetical protein